MAPSLPKLTEADIRQLSNTESFHRGENYYRQGALFELVYQGNELRVAQAAEADYPQAAIEIYCRQAERLIRGRGRDNYCEAAGLLVKVRSLYQRQGQSETWQKYLAQVREQNRQLPALKDELRKAGL